MHTLTKADITSTLSTLHDFSKEESQSLVEDFFDIISQRLAQGEEVKLSGFGRFVLHKKRARLARNPKTGESAWVTARTVVSYLPSVTLKAKFEMLAQLSQQAAVSAAGAGLSAREE
ncbi:MAG: Histone-like DNA-binding protein [Gammaproteobacteria bacterium]|jgi:integration host factor subunit alpha|nr:Histone-like DNA-binding protein [Gammaproteobacteria bacterium]